MKKTIIITLTSVIAIVMTISFSECTKGKITYPQTKKVDTVDVYFGTKISDPYRWLEDDNSQETAEWVKAQTEVTKQYFSKIPFRDQLKEKFLKIWDYPKEGAPFKAEKGDKYGKDVVGIYIQHLAEGIINIVNILRPQVVILGGGVCNEGDNLIKPLEELVFLRMYGGTEYAPVEIRIASLGNDAGLLGAFAFALQNL